jgi:chemotaxis protein CheX
MTVPVASPPNVVPPGSWPAILQQATVEVFSMMTGLEIAGIMEPAAQIAPEVGVTTVTGTVGIAGAISAIFSLRCSADCAAAIASGMLGISVAEAAAQQCDAIGEMCNIIAGQFKAKIGLEDKCMLSVPTVIKGGNDQLHAASATRHLELRLLCAGEPVRFALETRG